MRAGLVKMSEMEGVVAALLRADREAVLRRVEDCGTTMTIEYGNGQKLRHILINPDKLAVLKKEALK